MTTKFFDEILGILKNDKRNRFFSGNGELLRNAVYEAAMSLDNELIKLLLSNEKTKKNFFKDVDGVIVFDNISFGRLINNKEFLPDSYTVFKNKIGLIDENSQFISNNGNVVLSFPYKDCVLEGGQTKEDQKRGEIFYNEILAPDEVDRLLAPKVFTKTIKYSKNKIQPECTLTSKDNLIIKGNNLLALTSLAERYRNEVKLAYWDIPYNTDSDSFGCPDPV